MITTLSITLPHTPRCLSPNAKLPLTQRGAVVANKKKVSAKQRARHMAWAVTYKALQGQKFMPNFYTVRWFYKGAEPDDDNVLTRCKYYKDGACFAMGIERIHDLARAGKVEIVFEIRKQETN